MTTQTIEATQVPAWKINLPYIVLVAIMVGQAVAAVNVLAGQAVYIVANVVGIYHVFTLDRPRADKVKNVACFALTMSIIAIKTLGA